jgi:hypothetical protein
MCGKFKPLSQQRLKHSRKLVSGSAVRYLAGNIVPIRFAQFSPNAALSESKISQKPRCVVPWEGERCNDGEASWPGTV